MLLENIVELPDTQKVNEAARGGKLKNMDKEAQVVWAAKGLEAKKAAMGAMIDSFYAKEKQAKFKAQLAKATTPNKVDDMAKNVMLSPDNKVIK